MKLHKVRMYNLNSLYGEHIIDFENDLRNAPLFLILGQTGQVSRRSWMPFVWLCLVKHRASRVRVDDLKQMHV